MENTPSYTRRLNVDRSNRPPLNNPRIGNGHHNTIPAKFVKSRYFRPTNPQPQIRKNEYGAFPMKPRASDSAGILNSKTIPDSSLDSFDKKKENVREMASNWSFGHGSTKEGTSVKRSAKSLLFETCVANHWQPPLFECCEEQGPSHARMYRFKVIVEMKGSCEAVLESFGNLQARKKVAADHAAEGALWYIKHLGYRFKR